MATEIKKSKEVKVKKNQIIKTPKKWDLDNIDLGDADGSSRSLSTDGITSKKDNDKLPSEMGRITEL